MSGDGGDACDREVAAGWKTEFAKGRLCNEDAAKRVIVNVRGEGKMKGEKRRECGKGFGKVGGRDGEGKTRGWKGMRRGCGVTMVWRENGEVSDGRKGPDIVSAAGKGEREQHSEGMGRKGVVEWSGRDVRKDSLEQVGT